MKPRLASLLLALLLAAVAAFAAACNGDGQRDALTLEQYFQQVDRVVDDVAEQADELIEQAFTDVDTSSSEDAQLAASRVYLSGFLAIIESFLDDIGEIEPPAEANDAHDAFAEAAGEFADASRDVIERLEDVLSPGGLGELLADPDLNEAGDRVEQACFEVQDLAEEHGIDIDLNCALE